MNIDAINRRIWKEYPLYKGVEPKVRGSVLTYETTEVTPDGFRLKLRLRAEVSPEGVILKISESK